MPSWKSRDEILDQLGIRPQTLYAYVSRGLVSSRPDPSDPRRSLFSGDDADALMRKRARGRRTEQVARDAIAWGEAVLPTAISTIAHGRLYYRQRDAVSMAALGATLEEAAALLWPSGAPEICAAPLLRVCDAASPVAAVFSTLGRHAAESMPTIGRTPAALAGEAGSILRSMSMALGADVSTERDIAGAFARSWRCAGRQRDLIRMALVLLADHELNASTFAARVAASTGAPLAAAVLAGFSALLGPAHGTAPMRVRALLDEARLSGAGAAVEGWMRRGEALPGFGHPLYQTIDPRAEALIENMELPAALAELAAEAEGRCGMRPNIDFALAALVEALELPPDAPFILFAAGRCCGWLAHAIEQASTGSLIRPRARYCGPPLEPS